MSTNNFIPTLWSARLLANLNKVLVFAQPGVVNRDYEGEVSQLGDSVKINAIGRVTVIDYTKNTDLTAPQTLTDSQTILTITQSKAYNFQIDDVDKAQQSPKLMEAAMGEAAYALNNVIDQYIAGLYTDAASANLLGSDGTPVTVGVGTSDANAYAEIVNAKVVMDNANIPEAGRWIVIPPWIEGLLELDDRFVRYGTPAQQEVLMNGEIKRVAGFDILESNNVANTTGTKYKIMFGSSIGISMAMQVVKNEAYRMEKRFSDAMKGLALYGAKVIRPDAIGVITANKGTLA
jgi:N4-gp56 family major capsid protein